MSGLKLSIPSTPALARLIIILATCAMALALPCFIGWAHLGLAVEIAYTLALAILWNLLAGYAGIVSIGQQAFVGLGAYLLFALITFAGLPPLPAILLSGLATGAAAVPVGFILFRLRGAYLAIGSWVMAEIFRLSFAQMDAFGGGGGQSLPLHALLGLARARGTRELIFYGIALFLVALCTAGSWLFLRSHGGLGLTAIRDDQPAAASLGVNVQNLKFQVYVGVAVMTGMVGALIALQNLQISPDSAFSVADWTGDIIFIVVIGGIGTLEGPFIGTAIFFALRTIAADYGSWYLIALGALAILIMLAAPAGVWGALQRRYGFSVLPAGIATRSK